MKKYTKIISIVLSVLMVFSVIPFNTTAAAIDETKITSIDSFIETDNIIALVETSLWKMAQLRMMQDAFACSGTGSHEAEQFRIKQNMFA